MKHGGLTRMRLVAATLVLAFLVGCSGVPTASLDDMSLDPKRFDVGDRVFVEGFAIRPRDSVTFLCDELGEGRPPGATGRCVEVEGVPLTRAGRDLHEDGVWWDPEERSLDCLVVRRMPVDSNPERLVLSCVPRGSRP